MVSNLIPKDNRQISSLVIDSSQRVHEWNPIVGSNGVTKIEPYNEFGEGDYRLWFAIYTGEDLVWRVNGKYVVEVGYAQ